MFWGFLAVFAAMMALFAAVTLRPGFGRRITPERWMLWGGIVLPLPVILALTAGALWLGEGVAPRDAALTVQAEGRMWEWRFRYPDGQESVNLLHMPAGQDVMIEVTSPDVIHSFWIPRLGGKIDAIPGHTNRIRLHADAPGRYEGVCAEYCGTGHVLMNFAAVAHADWPPETME